MLVGLDFETYGSVDLPKHGLDRYVRDKYFRPLIGVMYYENDTPMRQLKREYDFVHNWYGALSDLKNDLRQVKVAAHNIGFEIEVLKHLGIHLDERQIIDSAVVARIAGAASPLSSAGPQLLDIRKMDEGRDLIKLFSVPGKYQERNNSMAFDPEIIEDYPDEWAKFMQYCGVDAQISYRIADDYGRMLSEKEQQYQVITLGMNMKGWPVDVASAQEMLRRYQENLEATEHDFHVRYGELNFNSLKQLKEFCADRGVKANSFDTKHVERMLKQVDKKLESIGESDPKWQGYFEVSYMLNTKKILGGSSLKKLQVILDTVGEDNRLRDQYLHCGAGQSLRTTGRSVQMQNLKRLGSARMNMDDLFEDDADFDNDTLAENMRQLFTSSDPMGQLIVGDFASVESRGLAWLADEKWKLDAYKRNEDLYVVLADKFGKTRQFGKVGELSCGYQAGADAVRQFAAGMGMDLTEGEAIMLVQEWRAACPSTVDFWSRLQWMLEQTINGTGATISLRDGFSLSLLKEGSPSSLRAQLQGVDLPTIAVIVRNDKGGVFLRRRFIGAHRRGRNIGYYKPTSRKTGDLWTNKYTDPKTKQVRFYEIYGGKLAGILTQSFCRELFFQSLKRVDDWCMRFDNVDLIGQFHDEIVLDWRPGGAPLELIEEKLTASMSDPGRAHSFPLSAEVKHDYRYIK